MFCNYYLFACIRYTYVNAVSIIPFLDDAHLVVVHVSDRLFLAVVCWS